MIKHLVVGGYAFHNNKVLLVHHNKLDIWIPVGGHIDTLEETPDEAIKREFKEETNLDIEPLNHLNLPLEGKAVQNLARPFHVNIHNVGDHNHIGFYYVCKVLNPEQLKINNELKGFEWFDESQLDDPRIQSDTKRQILEAFKIYRLISPI